MRFLGVLLSFLFISDQKMPKKPLWNFWHFLVPDTLHSSEIVQNGFPRGYFWFCIHYWCEQAKKMTLKFFWLKGWKVFHTKSWWTKPWTSPILWIVSCTPFFLITIENNGGRFLHRKVAVSSSILGNALKHGHVRATITHPHTQLMR